MAENEKEVTPVNDAPVSSPKNKDAKSAPEKPGFFARVGNFFVRIGRRLKKFWRDYRSEMKKVVWMPWKDVRKSTILVSVSVVAIGLAIGLVDFVFSEVISGVAGLIG